MSGKEGILKRHTEIRTALRFFLHSWYKHRQVRPPTKSHQCVNIQGRTLCSYLIRLPNLPQVGAVPYPQQVLSEFIKYKSLGTVIQKLQTPTLQVIRKEERQRR